MKNNSVESEKHNIDINNSHLSHVYQDVNESTIISDSHDTNYYQQSEKERILPINDSLNILMRISYFFYNELGIKKSIFILGPLLIINGTFSIIQMFYIDFTEKSIAYNSIVLIPAIITIIILGIIFVALQLYNHGTCPNCNKRYSLCMNKKFLLDKYTHIDKQYEKICEKYLCKFCGNTISKEKTIEYSPNNKNK